MLSIATLCRPRNAQARNVADSWYRRRILTFLPDCCKAAVSGERLTKLLSRLRPGRVAVLMYHDLRPDGDFDNWLRVEVSAFAGQLAALRRLGTFLSPKHLSKPETWSRRGLNFLLTFDDGYVNNLELAVPVLEAHRIPALFFISTRHMQEQIHFWPDIVVTVIQAGRLSSLDLTDQGFGRFVFCAKEGPRRWDDIERLLVAIKARGNVDHPQVAMLLDHLRRAYAHFLAEHLERLRPLKPEEVRKLAANPLCHIGSHAHQHDVLTRLPDAALAHSLAQSKRILEDLTGSPVTDLAYPDGAWDKRVAAAVAVVGYERAFRVGGGFMTPDCPSLALPRLGIGGIGPSWLTGYTLNRLFVAGKR